MLNNRQPIRPARSCGAVVCLLLAGGWTSPVPDVVLYTTPGMATPLRKVAQEFALRTRVEVHIFLAPPDGLAGLLTHRARADVVVADEVTLTRLAAAHLVQAETTIALGRDPFVLVASSKTVWPSAAKIVVPDPTAAASFDSAAILKASMQSPSATVGVADTPSVIAAVRDDPHVLGLVSRTESHAPGLTTVATLAAPPLSMAAARVTAYQSGEASSLLAFLAAPDGVATLRAGGLQ